MTYGSEWNISPTPTNCIIQFPSIAVRDNKVSKCQCKCSSTRCIIALLIACLRQNCCWALVQYLKACPGGVILLLFPLSPSCSSVLYLPSCSLCLCTEAESSREQWSHHHHHFDERWSYHQPSPIAATPPKLEGEGCCVTMTTTSNWSKWDQSRQ